MRISDWSSDVCSSDLTIIQHGMQRMLADQVDAYYYVTLMNENYTHPAMPEGSADGIIKGMYLLRDSGTAKSKSKSKSTPHVQLLGSGTILREVIAAAELLDKDFGVSADIWSRSEEHTSELQSLMRISYAVFC